jgi:hypothetical protein
MERVWQQLHEMGYRPLDEDRKTWAKPWGYTICTFEIEGFVWQQRFRNANTGEPLVWSREVWNEERDQSLVAWLAHAETFHTHQFTQGEAWNFRTKLELDL